MSGDSLVFECCKRACYQLTFQEVCELSEFLVNRKVQLEKTRDAHVLQKIATLLGVPKFPYLFPRLIFSKDVLSFDFSHMLKFHIVSERGIEVIVRSYDGPLVQLFCLEKRDGSWIEERPAETPVVVQYNFPTQEAFYDYALGIALKLKPLVEHFTETLEL